MEKKFSAAPQRIHAVINLAILGKYKNPRARRTTLSEARSSRAPAARPRRGGPPGVVTQGRGGVAANTRPLRGVGRPGDITRWPLFVLLITAAAALLTTPPTCRGAASKRRLRRCGFVRDGMRAARAASETNSATNAQIYETATRFGGLLSVRRTRPAYGRTSDAKGFDALRLSTSEFVVNFTAGFRMVCTAESTAVRAAISREYAHLSTLSTELSTARAQIPSGSAEKEHCVGALSVSKKLISKSLCAKMKPSKISFNKKSLYNRPLK